LFPGNASFRCGGYGAVHNLDDPMISEQTTIATPMGRESPDIVLQQERYAGTANCNWFILDWFLNAVIWNSTSKFLNLVRQSILRRPKPSIGGGTRGGSSFCILTGPCQYSIIASSFLWMVVFTVISVDVPECFLPFLL